MTLEEWKTQLAKEGFGELWVHTDEPGFVYKEHTHPVDTVYVVIQGFMAAWAGGDQITEFHTGDRWDVVKHIPHGSTIGPSGCTYITGVKV